MKELRSGVYLTTNTIWMGSDFYFLNFALEYNAYTFSATKGTLPLEGTKIGSRRTWNERLWMINTTKFRTCRNERYGWLDTSWEGGELKTKNWVNSYSVDTKFEQWHKIIKHSDSILDKIVSGVGVVTDRLLPSRKYQGVHRWLLLKNA